MKKKEQITGIILAGGKSLRMGNDKGFVNLNGKPFVSHIINTLKKVTDTIIIVSDNTAYNIFGCQRINDIIKNAGPLAGLYSGLIATETDKNIVISCDSPLINEALLKKLLIHDDNMTDIIQFKNQENTFPLIALYQKKCASKCLTLLEKGERRLRYAVSQFKTKEIQIPEIYKQNIININTPEELNKITNGVNY